MKKLAELVKVEENNENCVLLKVKPKSSLELMKIGCFIGTERYFRVTKNKPSATHTLTVWGKGENVWSMCWGEENTYASDMEQKIRFQIVDCIVKDFGISIDNQ